MPPLVANEDDDDDVGLCASLAFHIICFPKQLTRSTELKLPNKR